MMTIHLLTGTTAVLNGQRGIHSIEADFSNEIIKLDKEVVIIDDLFMNPHNLKKVTGCDNLIIQTSGQDIDDLDRLSKNFKLLDFTPKIIIFMTENSAISLMPLAKFFKSKGTKIFLADTVDNSSLWEIRWI